IPAVFVSAFLAEAVGRTLGTNHRLAGALLAGMLAQSGVLLVRLALAGSLHAPHTLWHALVSVPANGFAVRLLQMVATDAQIRARSEQHRLQAERAHALLAETQLVALRSRVHPHFLFNALTSIAALCTTAPVEAETAVIRLGQLMRRALEVDPATPVFLAEEIEYVRGYLEIE